MDKANSSLVFINFSKPELIFPATEIMLQTPNGTKIIPCSFEDIMNYKFHYEDVYVLEIEPKNEEEKNRLQEFIKHRKKTLKLWTADCHLFNQAGRQDSIGYVYELKKLGIYIPEYLQKRIKLIKLGHENLNDRETTRILKAIAVQKSFDFNIGKSKGYLTLIKKMITEIVTEKHDQEIETLAKMRSELIKNTERYKLLYFSKNLRGVTFRRGEFGSKIVIGLKEINPFLIDISDFAKSIKASKFIIEFSCGGYYHFLFIEKGEMLKRCDYAESTGIKKIRQITAKTFKTIEL
ncbi:MAG TPA: hypothetical protein VFD16_00610 [Candidatus Saccharimonadales bacterium]|nr:hypothetical protein [Candidatus Saccharimonadales bacterium]